MDFGQSYQIRLRHLRVVGVPDERDDLLLLPSGGGRTPGIQTGKRGRYER